METSGKEKAIWLAVKSCDAPAGANRSSGSPLSDSIVSHVNDDGDAVTNPRLDLNDLLDGVDDVAQVQINDCAGDWTGDEYEIKEDALNAYKKHAYNRGFSVRIMTEKARLSDPNKIALLTYCLSKQGYKRGSDIDPKNQKHIVKHVGDSSSTEPRQRSETRTGYNVKVRFHLSRMTNKFDLEYLYDEHNHPLHPPSASFMMRCNRSVDVPHRLLAEVNQNASIPLRSSYEIMQSMARGPKNLGFTKVDLKNALAASKRSGMQLANAGRIMEYFVEKCQLKPSLFYEVDIDENNQICNLFWADVHLLLCRLKSL